MRRSLTWLAVGALVAASLIPTPAAADDFPTPVVTVPGPSGPHLQLDLVASDDGRHLLSNGILVDADGATQMLPRANLSGAGPHGHRRSDGMVPLAGATEGRVLMLDMAAGTISERSVIAQPREVGAEGWIGMDSTHQRYVFTDWNGATTDLTAWDTLPSGMDRGHVTAWERDRGLWVIELATGDRYLLDGVRGDAWRWTSARGISWAEPPATGATLGQWCHAEWGSTVPTCSAFDLDANSNLTAVFPGADVLYTLAAAHVTVVTRSAQRAVALPESAKVVRCTLDDDTLSCLLKTADGWKLWSLSGDGVTVVDVPDVDHAIVSAHLTPDALYGVDDRTVFWPGQGAWRRDLTDGSETNLAATGVVAQGARAVIGKQWHLDGEAGQRLEVPGIRAISGPYALTGTSQTGTHTVVNADGRTVHAPGQVIHSIFGTNVLGARGTVDHVTGAVLQEGHGSYGNQLWGPWIMSSTGIWNRVTNKGVGFVLPGQHWGGRILLGDGVAVVVGFHDDSRPRSVVFDLSRMAAGVALQPALDLDVRVLALDGNRIAWTRPAAADPVQMPDGDITVSELPFGGTSSPYFLGVSGADVARTVTEPWQPQFDFTSDVAAGTLVIRDWNGHVVRTLSTSASHTRIIRDVVWDTRNHSRAVVPDGPYSWELKVTDSMGRPATASNTTSAITGTLLVGTGLVPVTAPAPVFTDVCGSHADTFMVRDVAGVTYHRDGKAVKAGSHAVQGSARITAVAGTGFRLTGTSRWDFAPSAAACSLRLPVVVINDLPGTARDTFTLPALPKHATGWLVNGSPMAGGTHRGQGSYSVAMRVEEGYESWGMVFSFSTDGADGPPAPSPAPTKPPAPFDVYTTEGVHDVNGRKWSTKCEPYSQTSRCRTEIWASAVTEQGGVFRVVNGWVFNNLTYLPMPRAAWKGNPIAGNGQVRADIEWTAADGRQWRTECDTALTGRNGCRSYVRASQIVTVDAPDGGKRYQWQTTWVMNNMVRFS